MSKSAINIKKQIKNFGYIKLDNIFDANDIDDLINEVTAMSDWPDMPGKYWRYYEENNPNLLNRMENFYQYSKIMQKIIDNQRLRLVLEQIMGDKPILFKEKINFKSSGGSGFIYHQDQAAGWSKYAPIFWSVAIAVDTCNAENGQLEIAKHISSTRENLGDWEPLGKETLKKLNFEPVSMNPGDIVIFDSFVPHGSKPNKSEKPRNMVYLTYNQEKFGNLRQQYYEDKRKSYPQDCERVDGCEYVYRV